MRTMINRIHISPRFWFLAVVVCASALLDESSTIASAFQKPSSINVKKRLLSTRKEEQLQSSYKKTRNHILSLYASEEDDDDDGWGTNENDSDQKTKELRKLQLERQQQQVSPRIQTSTTRSSEEPERDLFIPIFAIVSLIGLFGSYGYEMARLASRGELYLPWNN